MEFGIDKRAILIMISEKRERAEGIDQPNQGSIRTRGEKENYKYVGILKADTHKQPELKE